MDTTKPRIFIKDNYKTYKRLKNTLKLIKDMEKTYQKRIEKISQAVYLVSNHLKDTEPLKWELRKESIGFLSCIRSMSDNGDSSDLPPGLVIDALSTYAHDLISLLSLALVTGLISRSNGTLVIEEIQLLLASFYEAVSSSPARAGYILSHDFFATDPDLQHDLNKGQTNFISDKASGLFNEKIPFPKPGMAKEMSQVKNTKDTRVENDNSIKDKKDSRQVKILTLLRAKSHLSIKDFASVIPDCSEKTIQRELLELVEKGVIKKEGERRWSTYSLV